MACYVRATIEYIGYSRFSKFANEGVFQKWSKRSTLIGLSVPQRGITVDSRPHGQWVGVAIARLVYALTDAARTSRLAKRDNQPHTLNTIRHRSGERRKEIPSREWLS